MALTYELLGGFSGAFADREIVVSCSAPSQTPKLILGFVTRNSFTDSIPNDGDGDARASFGDRHLMRLDRGNWDAASSFAAETTRVDVFVLFASQGPIPETAQKFKVWTSASPASSYAAAVVAVYADDDDDWLTVHSTSRLDNASSAANPSRTITISGGTSCLCFNCIASSLNAPSDLTPTSGHSTVATNDFGNQVACLIVADSEDTANHTIGWTAASAQRPMVAFAIARETAGTLTEGRVPFIAGKGVTLSADPRQTSLPGTEGGSSDPTLADGVWAPGDLAIAVVWVRGSASVPPSPSGWTRAGSGTGSGMGWAVDYRFLQAGDTNTFDYSGTPDVTQIYVGIYHGDSVNVSAPIGNIGVNHGSTTALDQVGNTFDDVSGQGSWGIGCTLHQASSGADMRKTRPSGYINLSDAYTPAFGWLCHTEIADNTSAPSASSAHPGFGSGNWTSLNIELNAATLTMDVAGGTIASGAVLYAPTITPIGFVTAAYRASTAVLYAPSIPIPDQPTITPTAAGPRSVNVVGSPYSHPAAVPIFAVEWRRATNAGMSTGVETFEVEYAGPLDAPIPPEYGWGGLEPATNYWFDVRYRDQLMNWSPRSAAVMETTDAEDAGPTPTMTSATPGTEDVALVLSIPADPAGRSVVSIDWQVDESGGDFSSPVNEALDEPSVPVLTGAGTRTLTMPGLSAGTGYKGRGRVRWDDGAYSAYSAARSFTTLTAPTDRPEQPTVVVDQETTSGARVSRGSVYSDPDGSPHSKTRIYVTNYPSGPTFGLAYKVLDVIVNPSEVPYILSGLLSDRRHHVTIKDKALDGDWSDWSPWVEFFTLALPLDGGLLQIQQPRQGAVVRGSVPLEWTPNSSAGSTFEWEYTTDYATWIPIVSGLTSGPYLWDSTGLAADGIVVLRERAELDGEYTEWQYRIVYVDNANLEAGGTLLFEYSADDGTVDEDWVRNWFQTGVTWEVRSTGDVRYRPPGIQTVESAFSWTRAFQPRAADIIGEVLAGSSGGSFPWNWFPEQAQRGVGFFAIGGYVGGNPLNGFAATIDAVPINAYGDCELRGSGDGFLNIAGYENGSRILATRIPIGRVHVVNQFSGCNKVPRYGVRLRITTIQVMQNGRRRLRIQASVTGRGVTVPENGWHYEATVETGLDCGRACFVGRNINTTTNPYGAFTNLTVIPYEYGECEAPPSFPIPSENPQDCPFPELELTCFLEDDVTPKWGTADSYGNVIEASFSTNPNHPRPWLKAWKMTSPHEIDPNKGGSNVGGMRLQLLDKRTDPCDQGTGFLTTFLGDENGLNALIGRRWLAVEKLADGSVQIVHNGPLKDITMPEQIVAFDLSLASMRERERDVPLFDTQHETMSAFPYGPVEPYGRLERGAPIEEYLIDASEIGTGVYRQGATLSGLVYEGIGPGIVTGYISNGTLAAPHAKLTELGFPETTFQDAEDLLDIFRPNGFYTTEYVNTIVRWRYPGDGDDDWRYIRDMPAGGPGNIRTNLFDLYNVPPFVQEVIEWPDTVVASVVLNSYLPRAAAELPTPDAEIEYQVLADSAPSEAFPFYFDGPMGTLLRNIYDGRYSPADPRIGYDSACMDEFEATGPMALFYIVKPEKDIKSWVELNVYQASGWVPGLTDEGLICPMSNEVPSNIEALPLLDTGVIEWAHWSQSGSRASPIVEYTYIRETKIRVKDDPETIKIVSTPITIRGVYETAANLIKATTLSIAPVTVRTVNGWLWEDLNAENMNTAAAQLARGRVNDLLATNAFGPQIVPMRVRDNAITRPILTGQHVRLDPSWIPNLWALRRGGTWVAQVVRRIKDAGLAFEYDLLLKAGAAGGLTPPTLTPGDYGEVIVTFPPDQYEPTEETPPDEVPSGGGGGGGGGGGSPSEPEGSTIWQFNPDDYANDTELRNDADVWIPAFDEESSSDGAVGQYRLDSTPPAGFGTAKAMEYIYTRAANGISGCRSITIMRGSKRWTAVKGVAVDFTQIRWTPNFRTDNPACRPSDHKFAFIDTESDESGRIAAYISDQGFQVERPRDPDLGPGFTGAYTPNLIGSLTQYDAWDGAIHRLRMWFRHSTTTTSGDGQFLVWFDDQLIHEEYGFNTCKSAADGNAAEKSDGLSFCHNQDDGPEGVDMRIAFGKIFAYNAKPAGWT